MKQYTYTRTRDLRRAFWDAHKHDPLVNRTRIPSVGNCYNTHTRCAFVDWIDHLEKSGQISADLAQRITLGD